MLYIQWHRYFQWCDRTSRASIERVRRGTELTGDLLARSQRALERSHQLLQSADSKDWFAGRKTYEPFPRQKE
jgi:hypothetical protein